MNRMLLCFLSIVFSYSIYGQKKQLDCDTIIKGVVDEKLYDKLENGKLVAIPRFKEYRIYRVVTNEGKSSYFVTEKLMKKIRKAIKKNECEGVKIVSGAIKKSETDIKIIRD